MERIILGSGHTYVTEFANTIPEDTQIEVEGNLLGATSGGASLEYTQEKYTAKSDDGTKTKTIIVDENAVLKTGIMTLMAENLKKLVETGRVSTSGKRTSLKIGGANNADGKNYLVRFVHKDAVDGDVRITIVGKNQGGLTMAFAKDKEVVVDAEFKAEAMDAEGTLVQIDFDEPAE